MEKNEVLDTVDHAKTMTEALMGRSKLSRFLSAAIWILLLVSGCTLPRIAVLEDPLTPEEHLNLGVAYERTGEFENAIREYELAARKLPVAYLYLGNVHLQKNELDEAERFYRKSIRKEPDNADAHNNLAWLYYMKRDKLDEAESLAIRAIELNPAKSEIYRDTLDRIREQRMAIQ